MEENFEANQKENLGEKLSAPAFVLVWFAASISLAEILTGTFFAPLGLVRGIQAIVIGHVIGGVLFGLAAYIGAATQKSAMETVKISFGKYGSFIFSIANIAQLIGWTAIMIFSGATAATYLVPLMGNLGWCLVITGLIVLWITLGIKNMSRIQSLAALLLFALTLLVSFVVFGDPGSAGAGLAGGAELAGGTGTTGATSATGATSGAEALSFGAAVELAVAMPLSWLPVVSDYTRRARRAVSATTGATLGYFFGSCWMFIIGLGAALFADSSDISVIMAGAGLGVVGILIVVFSTVTTTFLDASSAGISATSISKRLNAKYLGIGAAVLGGLLAFVAPVARFEGFLYLIGSFFAPMIAILVVDFFILKNDASTRSVNVANLLLWVGGFVLYRFSMSWDFVLGNTLPVMVIVGLASVVVHLAMRRLGKENLR
ncbi:MAG: putative hydroxymethylpyrimidine transporter CytX [Eggerthellaceae bacterium]|nr:putative hydroxymethylpyrimidine transporter CytX [Eggerthellaceae bacterium]